MKYYTRRWIRPNDLNAANRLFGGQLLCQMKHEQLVTKYISEIDFMAPAEIGDVVEFGLEVVATGVTSLTVKCQVRKKSTQRSIITIDQMVFVAVDAMGKPVRHGYALAQAQAG